MTARPFTFGPFALDPAQGLLVRDGARVALGGRAFAILEALAQAGGEVVPKAALIDRAWPGLAVEDGNLTVQIAALRKALGPRGDGAPWIATAARVGYRLMPDEPAASAPPAVALLRFAAPSGDPALEAFADALASDLVTALARFRGFAVISRGSLPAFLAAPTDVRRAAAELGARYLLEGDVRRREDRLLVHVELTDGESGAHVWAERFEGAVGGDPFALLDQIVERVAAVVEPSVRRAERERARRARPGSAAPYDVNLEALGRILTESEPANAEAYGMLTKALARTPDDPMLLAYAAWALEHRTTMGWRALGPGDREICADLARRGLERAAGDATVMTHCAMALLQTAREYEWGMAALAAAADANPHSVTVMIALGVGELHCGTVDRALAQFHRAISLGPRDPLAHTALCGLAHAHMILRDYPEAIRWGTRALAINPNFDATLWMLTAANAHLGDLDAAGRYREALERLCPGITIARIRKGQPAKDPAPLAAILEGLRRAGLPEA